jgi:uncharacterized membrane protein YkoI
MKGFLQRRWVVPVATLVLTLSIGSAAFAAAGSSSTDTSASGTSSAVTSADSTATSSAATGTDSSGTNATTQPSAPAGATADNPWGNQRSDETLLTGDALAQVKAIALAKAGSDATIVRIETDSEASLAGHAAYEAHVVKADGTAETVYVDQSFNYVSTETQPACIPQGGPGGDHGPNANSASTSTNSTSTSTN